jgi:hypothetical protein
MRLRISLAMTFIAASPNLSEQFTYGRLCIEDFIELLCLAAKKVPSG